MPEHRFKIVLIGVGRFHICTFLFLLEGSWGRAACHRHSDATERAWETPQGARGAGAPRDGTTGTAPHREEAWEPQGTSAVQLTRAIKVEKREREKVTFRMEFGCPDVRRDDIRSQEIPTMTANGVCANLCFVAKMNINCTMYTARSSKNHQWLLVLEHAKFSLRQKWKTARKSLGFSLQFHWGI